MDAPLFLRALRRNPHGLRKVDQNGQEQRDGQTQREEALRKPTLGLRTCPVSGSGSECPSLTRSRHSSVKN